LIFIDYSPSHASSGRPRYSHRVVLAADVGFGKSFVEKDWSIPDLVGLLSLVSHNEEVINNRNLWSAVPGRTVNLLAI